MLPEGLENVIIEGDNDVWVLGNSHDNQITGNLGNNVIDGGEGNDTFVTQGNFDQSTGILNRDGSVRLTSDGGGTDLLVNIENVQFDDQLKLIDDIIDIKTNGSNVFNFKAKIVSDDYTLDIVETYYNNFLTLTVEPIDEIYGVYLNEKAFELNKKAMLAKSESTDAIIVELKGNISTEKHEVILWEKKFEIIEIVEVRTIKETKKTLIFQK